jgi:hypothetical protein
MREVTKRLREVAGVGQRRKGSHRERGLVFLAYHPIHRIPSCQNNNQLLVSAKKWQQRLRWEPSADSSNGNSNTIGGGCGSCGQEDGQADGQDDGVDCSKGVY